MSVHQLSKSADYLPKIKLIIMYSRARYNSNSLLLFLCYILKFQSHFVANLLRIQIFRDFRRFLVILQNFLNRNLRLRSLSMQCICIWWDSNPGPLLNTWANLKFIVIFKIYIFENMSYYNFIVRTFLA